MSVTVASALVTSRLIVQRLLAAIRSFKVLSLLVRATGIEQYDVGPCVDPLQALLDLAAQAVRWKDLLGDRVSQLAAHDWRYESRTGEQVRSELLLFEKAVDRCAKILADIARLNLDDRLLAFHTQIEQQKAARWGDILEAALEDVLPPALIRSVGRRFGQRLRAAQGADLPPLGEVPAWVRADSIDRPPLVLPPVGDITTTSPATTGPDEEPTGPEILPAEPPLRPPEPLEPLEATETASRSQPTGRVRVYDDPEPERPPVLGPDGRPVTGPPVGVGSVEFHDEQTLDELFGERTAAEELRRLRSRGQLPTPYGFDARESLAAYTSGGSEPGKSDPDGAVMPYEALLVVPGDVDDHVGR